MTEIGAPPQLPANLGALKREKLAATALTYLHINGEILHYSCRDNHPQAMNNKDIRKQLALLCSRDQTVVFLKDELRTLFLKGNEETFNSALRAFVAEGTLWRISKGVYCYAHLGSISSEKVVGQAIAALRPNHLTYLSLESSLSAYGIISQIPFRLTFITTGRSGEVKSELGTFEFTHTDRDPTELLKGIYTGGEYYRAMPHTALRDLRRVGRNCHLVDLEFADEILKEYALGT